MAANSILKTVHINNPQSAEKLTSALEYTATQSPKESELKVTVSDASREDIRKMFGIAK